MAMITTTIIMCNSTKYHTSPMERKFQLHLYIQAPRKYVFWGPIQYSAGQRYTLIKLQNAGNFKMVLSLESCRQRKKSKVRAHNVKLGLKLGSVVG